MFLVRAYEKRRRTTAALQDASDEGSAGRRGDFCRFMGLIAKMISEQAVAEC
jgi:hypothetical protein